MSRKQKTQKRHRAIRNKVAVARAEAKYAAELKSPNTKQLFAGVQINGSTERPRLSVYRSNNHIYAQVPWRMHHML